MTFGRIFSWVGVALLSAVAFGEADSPASVAQPAANVQPVAERTADDFETRTFVLHYAKVVEVADSLNALCRKLGVKEAAVAFPDSHTVAVAASPKVVAACAKIVADVDRKPKQVYVEARFLDLVEQDAEQLGIGWNFLKGTTIQGDAGVSYKGELPRGGSYTDGTVFTGTLKAEGLSLVLAALKENQDNRMIANPRIVVGSGKSALVDISTKRPNVIISAKRTTNQGSNNFDVDSKIQVIPGTDKLMFADEAFFWWGVGLIVEPYVGEDGVISARIVPNVSHLSDYTEQSEGPYVEVVPQANGESMPASRFPIIDVKRIETEFSLKSGETAVVGGLSRTEISEYESGIPYLWKIPVIGPYIFGYKEKIVRQREIVVLVTMGLVDPEAPDKAAGLPKNAVVSREYVNGNEKEPGDYTKEELNQMFPHKNMIQIVDDLGRKISSPADKETASDGKESALP